MPLVPIHARLETSIRVSNIAPLSRPFPYRCHHEFRHIVEYETSIRVTLKRSLPHHEFRHIVEFETSIRVTLKRPLSHHEFRHIVEVETSIRVTL